MSDMHHDTAPDWDERAHRLAGLLGTGLALLGIALMSIASLFLTLSGKS